MGAVTNDLLCSLWAAIVVWGMDVAGCHTGRTQPIFANVGGGKMRPNTAQTLGIPRAERGSNRTGGLTAGLLSLLVLNVGFGGLAVAQSGDSSRLLPWVSGAGQAIGNPASGASSQVAQKSKAIPAEKASAAVPDAPQRESWAVTCSNRAGGFLCEMTQAIIDGKTRTLILLISIKSPQANAQPAILFRSIHGVYLPAGLTMSIDAGGASNLQFQKSDQLGAYAALPLSTKFIDDLKRGRELVIAIEINKGEKLELRAPLQGFATAFDRVVAKY